MNADLAAFPSFFSKFSDIYRCLTPALTILVHPELVTPVRSVWSNCDCGHGTSCAVSCAGEVGLRPFEMPTLSPALLTLELPEFRTIPGTTMVPFLTHVFMPIHCIAMRLKDRHKHLQTSSEIIGYCCHTFFQYIRHTFVQHLSQIVILLVQHIYQCRSGAHFVFGHLF